MSAHKFQHIIFTQNRKLNLELNLLLDGKKIPLETHPTFLGISLDKYLTFNKHFSRLIKKSQNRLNIIKILSNKSWSLNHKIRFNIYKSLVGSIFDYSFFCFPCLCHTRSEKIQVIQNTAIGNILKLN
jgi:hypothetical protein